MAFMANFGHRCSNELGSSLRLTFTNKPVIGNTRNPNIQPSILPSLGSAMAYDTEKVDEYTLALLYLVIHSREEGYGARAWKGFDWETLNRLHEKGLISNPVGKAKSVVLSEEGFKMAEEFFIRHFGKP